MFHIVSMFHNVSLETLKHFGTQNLKTMFTLEKYKGRNSRYECPQCRDKKSFTRYIDENGNYLSDIVGRCDHESSCGYHYTPKEFFKDNPQLSNTNNNQSHQPYNKANRIIPQPKRLCTIPKEYAEHTLWSKRGYSTLISYLIKVLGEEQIKRAMNEYCIGTTKEQDIIYWQIDVEGRIRTGKVMKYDTNGHRVKDGCGVNWIHSLMKKHNMLPEDWELTQCLFGEHLLNIAGNENKVVAIVESEKTALICSALFSQCIWLAVGGKSQLSIEKMKVLKGRTIIMYPDIDGYDTWCDYKQRLPFCKVTISDLLETNATEEERQRKIDIADVILQNCISNKRELSEDEKLLNIMITRTPQLKLFIEKLKLTLVCA